MIGQEKGESAIGTKKKWSYNTSDLLRGSIHMKLSTRGHKQVTF
jgi:hypothetical protein